MGFFMGFNVKFNDIPSGYVNSLLLKMVICSGFSHEKCMVDLSIVM